VFEKTLTTLYVQDLPH